MCFFLRFVIKSAKSQTAIFQPGSYRFHRLPQISIHILWVLCCNDYS